MEVRYESAEHGELNVFTRMPEVGESIESVVKQYSPISYWREQMSEVEDVDVGASGAITYSDELTEDDLKMQVREMRDYLLEKSDFTQMPDAPDYIDKVAWQSYRQLLREIPEQDGFPSNVVWPERPINF
jgi:hypothetical protein